MSWRFLETIQHTSRFFLPSRRRKIFGKFDKGYCINLADRTDRRQDAKKRFASIGLKNVAFIKASRPPDEGFFRTQGTHGCALSHAGIFRLAKQNGFGSIIVFEDDVVFSEGFNQRMKPILEDLEQVDWDIFYLFSPRKGNNDLRGDRGDVLKRYDSGLLQVAGTIMTHAYAINCRCLDVLIEKTDPSYISKHLPIEIRAIDKVLATLDLKFFACDTDLTYQDPKSHSSIEIPIPHPPL